MSHTPSVLLCHYRYDPLDRLAGREDAGQGSGQCFYQKSRLTTEIQGQARRSWLQTPQQLLAQRRSTSDISDATLIATDAQGSVLHGLDASQPQAYAYSAYGNRHPALDPLHLPGFNRERADPVTGHYLLGNGYRAFNPVLMRFNRPDSLSPFGRGGLNAYAYCAGDPINHVDPGGNWSKPSMLLGRRWSMGDADIFLPERVRPRRNSAQTMAEITSYQKNVLENTEAEALGQIASYLYEQPGTLARRAIHAMNDQEINTALRGPDASKIGPSIWLSWAEDMQASLNPGHPLFDADVETLRSYRAEFSRRLAPGRVEYAVRMRNAKLGPGFSRLMDNILYEGKAGVSIAMKYTTPSYDLDDYLFMQGPLRRLGASSTTLRRA